MKNVLASSILAVIALSLSLLPQQSASAQTPDKMFGVGLFGGANFSGVELVYAVTPSIHIGSGLGFALISVNSTSKNSISFSPFARFIFAGKKNFKPYLFGSFAVMSSDIYSWSYAGIATGSKTALGFGAGAFYFPANDFDVFGQITVVGITFDPSSTAIGTINPQVGAHWYFN